MITHPTAAQLLEAVQAYLADPAGPAPGYMALVARNALGIVARELALGPAAIAAAEQRLRDLLGMPGDLATLEAELCARLRDGRIAPDDPALQAHLRAHTRDRLAIDQPRYRHQMPS